MEIVIVSEKLRVARKQAREVSTSKLDLLNIEIAFEYKQRRNASGLHDGTYNFVCAASQQAGKTSQKEGNLPQFKRWMDGPGTRASLGQQIKSSSGRLLVSTPAESSSDHCIFDGKDTRVQLSVPDGRGHSVLRLRFASGEKRQPIWAEFPVVLHRPLPEDAEIKQVRVVRTRIGPYRGPKHTRWRWEAVFFVESRSFHGAKAQTRLTAAVDLGWALSDEGGLRIGYLVGSDGAQAEIQLPDSLVERFRIPEVIASKRKVEFNKALSELKAWVDENPTHPACSRISRQRKDGTQISALAVLAGMKSPSSLSRIAWSWNQNRESGDEAIWSRLDLWRRKNDHLHQWEAGARTKAVLARKEWYRVLASRLARRYDRIIFEDLDLSVSAKSKVAGSNRVVASPSEFRSAVEALLGVHRIPAAYTSRLCSKCGGVCEWDMKTYRTPTCSRCGTVWDRDANAGANILAASGVVVAETQGPLDLVQLRGLPCPKPVSRPLESSPQKRTSEQALAPQSVNC